MYRNFSASSESDTITWLSQNKSVVMSLVLEILIPFMSSFINSVIILFMYMLNKVVKWGSLIELRGFNHNLDFHF
jgi:hypothetical protein